MVATSPKGWTSNALGLKWLKKHFEPHTQLARKNKYRMLILDGHRSHIIPEFMDFCESHKIILLCLPAHTSHMLQPLDVAVFSPTKHWYRKAIDQRLYLGDLRIPKSEFLDIYSKTRPRSLTSNNIQAGFRKAGLVPFNPATVLRQLPIPPLETPNPTMPLHLQTPKTVKELHNAIDALKREGSDCDAIQVKISKAAVTAFNDRLILQQEYDELRAHANQKQKKASRKRKRVPGQQEQTVNEVRKALETPKRQRTTRRTAQQPRRSPTPSDSETDPDSPYEVYDDDMNSSIIVVAPQ
jgi:DDE superfamily endonuclease